MISDLAEILKQLKLHGVQVFRHKDGDKLTEIVFSGGELEVEEDDEETMEDKDVSIYSTQNIGITKRGFDDDVEEATLRTRRRG